MHANLFPERRHLREAAQQQHRQIITESCRGLNLRQRDIVENINREFASIVEATLTSQQIQDIFGAAERSTGNNRTLLGRGVDTARAVDDAINKAGRWLQDTRPVQGFDRRFEQLKDQISTKFPDLTKTVEGWGTWAKANPGKTAAVIGVLTTIAALAGGPVGGAVAGQILRGTAELMKGERLSTAVGKGVKTAAYGALAGLTINQIGDWLQSGIKAAASDVFPGAGKLDLKFTASGTGPGTFQDVQAYGRLEDVQAVKQTFDQAAAAWGAGELDHAVNMFDRARDLAAKMADPQYVASLTQDRELARDLLAQAKTLSQATDAAAAAAQGAVQGSGNQQQTTESQVRAIFRNVAAQYLAEHILHEKGARDAETQARMQAMARGDRVLPTQQQAADRRYPDRSKDPLATPKPGVIATQPPADSSVTPKPGVMSNQPAAGSTPTPKPQATNTANQPAATSPSAANKQPNVLQRAASAVGRQASRIGKNLTTRITADKLASEWEARGRPTDDAAVVDILRTMKVDDAVISRAFGEVGLTPPAPAAKQSQRVEPGMVPASNAAAPNTPSAAKTKNASPTSTTTRPGLTPRSTNNATATTSTIPAAANTELSAQGARIYAALQKSQQYLTPQDRSAIRALLS